MARSGFRTFSYLPRIPGCIGLLGSRHDVHRDLENHFASDFALQRPFSPVSHSSFPFEVASYSLGQISYRHVSKSPCSLKAGFPESEQCLTVAFDLSLLQSTIAHFYEVAKKI